MFYCTVSVTTDNYKYVLYLLSMVSQMFTVHVIYYSVDKSRVRDVGPDRAAAEWILRLGGVVKFSGREHWSDDYNKLPSGSRESLRLLAIDASGISITTNGLEHLGKQTRSQHTHHLISSIV